ncbi:MAG: TIGR01212 family radical SAM protein [Spirochaetes bacterium]|nr:TIGR01212 family radical SAM protein [Spirochaetota bacterium]
MVSRFNRHGDRLVERHGQRVYRLGVDAGFTCPHREGGRGKGGCAFCAPEAGLAAYQHDGARVVVDLDEQIERAASFAAKRYKASLFFLYFQAYSCTNLPVEELKPIYDRAIATLERLHPGSLAGLVVSTRPDCIDPGKAALLASFADSGLEVWVELGLQSSTDRTLAEIGRGHDAACYARAAKITGEAGLRRAVHLILGLPGEGREEMLASVDFAQSHGIEGIKFHDLRLAKGSALARRYPTGEFSVLHTSRLPSLLADCLEILPAEVEVLRLGADFPSGSTIEPFKPLEKFQLYQAVEAELERRGSRQGSKARLGRKEP